jgi:two-component system response regulator PrrA
MRVLVVDDDAETRELVAAALAREGFEPTLAPDAGVARDRIRNGPRFDVVVLDVMLGDASGLALCAAWRAEGLEAPILFLSARGAVDARVEGLEAGGDDYLRKPFAIRELCARVRALGRRGPALVPDRWTAPGVSLDFAARRAEVDGREVPVTAREWALLRVLADARGRVVPFDDVLERAWGEVSERSRASLDVIVARLRRKLARRGADRSVLRTTRGAGYSLEGERESTPP